MCSRYLPGQDSHNFTFRKLVVVVKFEAVQAIQFVGEQINQTLSLNNIFQGGIILQKLPSHESGML